MADGLKLAQLGGIFSGMAQSQAAYNPAQKVFADYLQGSSQSAIAAEAQKKAEKKAKKGKSKGVFGALAGAATVAAAPFTGGASLSLLPLTVGVGTGIDRGIAGDWGGALAHGLGGSFIGGAYDAVKGGDMGAAVSNAANAAGGMYGGGNMGVSGGAPASPANPETDPAQLLEMDGITPLKKSLMNLPPPSNPRGDVWANTMGGAAQRAGVISIANKSGRELRRDLLSSPNAERALVQYLQAGGQLTPQQMRMLPASTKRVVRTYGYDVPGPFGMLSF